MTNNTLSRRAFLRTATETSRNSLVLLSTATAMLVGREAHAAMIAGAQLTTLEADEAEEFAAIAARIIPSDETPGATEAGVIYFIDRVLGGERSELLTELRSGLTELQNYAAASYGGTNFSDRPAAQQDALLRSIEDTSFFNSIRYLTIAGMFSSPALGGNRNQVGWELLGFEDRHAWMPPYGYYDGKQMEEAD